MRPYTQPSPSRLEALARVLTEPNVGVHALNRMLEFGRPKYVRTA